MISELKNMKDDAPDQIVNIEASIEQIEDQIIDIQRQIDAVNDELCTATENDLIDYLNNTKIPELEVMFLGTDLSLNTGITFGTISYTDGNIIDWVINDSNSGNIYAYEGVNWDNDSTIIELVNDYAFGNDYLTRPLTTGATYGLIPTRNNLQTVLGILENNRNKINNSINVFKRYI